MSDSLVSATSKKDFSTEFKILLPEAQAIAESGTIDALEEALQLLLTFEKKCRLNNDFNTLKEVCLAIVRIVYGYNKSNLSKLNATLLVLNKRRSQSKVAIAAIVQEALSYLDEINEIDTKIELIKTLITICEGKIYVEGESARLHLTLALIYEKRGDLSSACDMIQDVHVETYGSLSKKEKADYILEQIRLNLMKKDFIRTMIQSRKMNRKTIELDGFLEVKRKFYTLMMEYYFLHEKNPWEICLCYHKIYETYLPTTTSTDPPAGGTMEEDNKPESILDSSALLALESCVIFLVLSPYTSLSSDMLHRLKTLKHTSKESPLGQDGLPYTLLQLFTTNEIIPQQFSERTRIESHASLHAFGSEYSMLFSEVLSKRIIEHNLRVLSKCYTRIRLERIAQLLDLSAEVVELRLAEVATSGDIYVKINRSLGIVNFAKTKSSEEVLSEWGSDVGKLLRLMESTCHLIHRESMVYKV